MHKTMAVAALSFLMAVGGGAALAEAGGGQAAPSAAAPSSEASGQPGNQKTRANAPGPVGFAEEEVQTAPWTVQRVDKKNHSLVLQAPDGTQNTVNIPAGTPGFDGLAKGDQVQLDYFDAAVIGVPASNQAGSTSASGGGQSAAANNTNRKVRNIRKVGHNGSNNMGHSGNSGTTGSTGATEPNQAGQSH